MLCLCLHVLDRTHLGVTLYNKNGGGQHYGENDSNSCFVHHNSCYIAQPCHDCCHDSSYHGDGRKRQVGAVNTDHSAR